MTQVHSELTSGTARKGSDMTIPSSERVASILAEEVAVHSIVTRLDRTKYSNVPTLHVVASRNEGTSSDLKLEDKDRLHETVWQIRSKRQTQSELNDQCTQVCTFGKLRFDFN